MAAADHEAALARLAPLAGELPLLQGPPVDATWDPDRTLARAQRACTRNGCSPTSDHHHQSEPSSVFGMAAWQPRVASTTWVTPMSTATEASE
jgi:hypothetical protein